MKNKTDNLLLNNSNKVNSANEDIHQPKFFFNIQSVQFFMLILKIKK